MTLPASVQRPGEPLPVYDSARRPHPFVEEAVDLVRSRELLALWSLRNLTLRYKRSALGILWTLLEPLMMMAILSVVFTAVFRFAIENYPVYVLSGILLFNFFSRATEQMMDEIVTSQHVAGRIHAPRSAFILAAVVTQLVNWLLALIPFFGLMLVLDVPFSPALASLPLGIAVAVLFTLGIGLVVATLAAFFPDVKLMHKVLLTAWFYATPIIYPVEIVPESWRPLLQLNPLFHLCELIRDPVFAGSVAPLESWVAAVLASLAAAALGWWIFTSRRDAFGVL